MAILYVIIDYLYIDIYIYTQIYVYTYSGIETTCPAWIAITVAGCYTEC